MVTVCGMKLSKESLSGTITIPHVVFISMSNSALSFGVQNRAMVVNSIAALWRSGLFIYFRFLYLDQHEKLPNFPLLS